MSHLLAALRGTAPQPKLRFVRLLSLSPIRLLDGTPSEYQVNASAEPLSKYKIGGYHPVHLGARFKYGRYEVSHKLGWGGEGTVWLSKDLQASRLVALKILTADERGENEEAALLKDMSGDVGFADHPGMKHLIQLLDSFWHTGPNGTHECLVTDIAGNNAQDRARECVDLRLPAAAAWSIAKQTVQAVDLLHTLGVAHADIHTRNIMLSPKFREYSSVDLLDTLSEPHTAPIKAMPPNELNQHLPKYLVENTPLPYPATDPSLWHAQLVDFGQSFSSTALPKQSRTPLVLRAPELLLSQTWDYRIDIWSIACTIFELVTGKPPFDPIDSSVNRLVQDWIDLFGDLPDGWKGAWNYSTQWGDDEYTSITGWLKECYFEKGAGGSEGDEHRTFSGDDLECLGDLLEQMFKYRPEERLDTRGILAHEWFARSPL